MDGQSHAINVKSSTLFEWAISRYSKELPDPLGPTADSKYIQDLLAQELVIHKRIEKAIFGLLVLNSLSLVAVQKLQVTISVFGQDASQLAAFPQVLCFLLGLNIFGFSIANLDLLLITRLRYAYILKYGKTTFINLTTAQLKGSNIWMDLVSPWVIAELSSPFQKLLCGGVSKALIIFMLFLYLASGFSLFEIYGVTFEGAEVMPFWGIVISTVGLLMGVFGIAILFGVQKLPFKFIER